MSQLHDHLRNIVKPEFLPSLASWTSTATRDEVKGLKIMDAICKYKGAKRFRIKPTTARRVVPSLRELEEQMRRKQLQSTYVAEFAASKPDSLKPAILRLRKLSDLPCSSVLSSVALRFLETWLELEDDVSYQELVLVSLRSIAATVNASRQAVSEQKKQFVWIDPSRGFSPQRVSHVAAPTRSKSSRLTRPQLSSPTKADTSFDSKVFTKEDQDRRKRILIKGSGAITSWVGAPQHSATAYQDSYVTHITRYHQAPHPDFRTSISLGRLIPTSRVGT
jgi:hypothetical protein